MNTKRFPSFLLAFALALLVTGCQHKTTAKAVPPPPPSSPAAAPAPALPSPVASLTITPASVDRGQPAELRWSTQHATVVNIDGLGAVPATGSQKITPGDSTTYRLVAKGDGGTTEASARITVNAASAMAADLTEEQLFDRNVKDVFFSYGQADIRSEEQQIVSADAQFLAQHPGIKLVIAGHCDERGSDEYNMGLGENRAGQVKEELVKRGINSSRIRIISYGKEKPFCTTAEEESCWQQNRRAHFAIGN